MPDTGNWLGPFITAGPSGDDHVWFSNFSSNAGLWSVSTTAPDPAPQDHPAIAPSRAGIAVGADNHLWVAQTYGPRGHGPVITGITADGGAYAEYELPYESAIDDLILGQDNIRWVWAITAADNGYLYFTELRVGRIGCFKPGTPPTRCGPNADWPVDWQAPYGLEPRDITQGPDGKLYFTMWDVDKIGCMTLTGEFCDLLTWWEVPDEPTGITVGPDDHLWFTSRAGDKIGRIIPGTRAVLQVTLPAGSDPVDITQGPPGDYAVWFTEYGANKIGRLNVTDPETFRYPPQVFDLPGGNHPSGITVGPDNRIWFTEATANKIGVVNPVSP